MSFLDCLLYGNLELSLQLLFRGVNDLAVGVVVLLLADAFVVAVLGPYQVALAYQGALHRPLQVFLPVQFEVLGLAAAVKLQLLVLYRHLLPPGSLFTRPLLARLCFGLDYLFVLLVESVNYVLGLLNALVTQGRQAAAATAAVEAPGVLLGDGAARESV